MDLRPELDELVRSALDDNPRVALIASRRLRRDRVPWLERRAVRLARQDGWSWARIGRLLGISAQAARKRFRELDRLAPRLPPTPVSPAELAERDFFRIRRDARHLADLAAWEASGTGIVPW